MVTILAKPRIQPVTRADSDLSSYDMIEHRRNYKACDLPIAEKQLVEYLGDLEEEAVTRKGSLGTSSREPSRETGSAR